MGALVVAVVVLLANKQNTSETVYNLDSDSQIIQTPPNKYATTSSPSDKPTGKRTSADTTNMPSSFSSTIALPSFKLSTISSQSSSEAPRFRPSLKPSFGNSHHSSSVPSMIVSVETHNASFAVCYKQLCSDSFVPLYFTYSRISNLLVQRSLLWTSLKR